MRKLVMAFPLLTALALSSQAQVSGSNDFEPEPTGIGRKLPLAERQIAIHRSRSVPTATLAQYFHRPLYVLKVNPAPLAGYPDIVHFVKRDGTKTVVVLRVILTTEQFQEDARAFAISYDPSLREPNSKVEPAAINVQGWPIMKLRVKATERYTPNLLAQWDSPDLSAAPPEIEVPLSMDASALAVFKREAPTGGVEIAFLNQYRNVRQGRAFIQASATRELNQKLKDIVDSEVKDSGKPIFQQQMMALIGKFSTAISSTSWANDPTLLTALPNLHTGVIEKYFAERPVSVQTLPANSPLREAIYGYLKPLIRSFVDTKTEEDKTKTTSQQGVDIKIETEVFSVKPATMSTIERTAGVTFQKQATDNSFVPATIKVFTTTSVSDLVVGELAAAVFVSAAGSIDFQDDTPINTLFNTRELATFKSGGKATPFDGVLPGMAFCFFGEGTPRGYLEVKSGNRWPTAAGWPDHLRGKSMPDTRNVLVGVGDEEAVGSMWSGGKIAIGTLDVPAEGLTLTQTTNETRGVWDPRPNTPTPNPFPQPGTRPVYPTMKGVIGIGAGSFEFGIAAEIKPTAIAGKASVAIPEISLDSASFNPPHIRCRLMVKQ